MLKTVQLTQKINLAIVGNSGVGKTSLVECFLTGEPQATRAHPSTFTCQTKVKRTSRYSREVSLTELKGDYQNMSQLTSLCREAHCIVLCYCIANLSSFKSIDYWLA